MKREHFHIFCQSEAWTRKEMLQTLESLKDSIGVEQLVGELDDFIGGGCEGRNEEGKRELKKRKGEMPPSQGLLQETHKFLKQSNPKTITFHCKTCKKWIHYEEKESVDAYWLYCKCRCMCDCHFFTNWKEKDCQCTPCHICIRGIDTTSRKGPVASCGRQRMCHFGDRCRYKDISCGFRH